MSPPRDPWRDVRELLVDGTNLLRSAGGVADEGARRVLLARLAFAVPPNVLATVVFDGAPDPGAPSHVRIRHGLEVRHAGRLPADRVLVDAVAARPFGTRDTVLVVTDDIELRERARRAGGRTQPLAWLVDRLDRPAAGPRPGTSVGSGPRGSATPHATRDRPASGTPDAREDDRPRWKPGRGATAKRGNPRRGHPGPGSRT